MFYKFKDIFYKIKSWIIKAYGEVQIFPYPMFILFKSPHYKIKDHHKRQIMNLLHPGDVLLRRYDHYISGKHIPGYWTHAAIYVDSTIIHMLGDGVTSEDILKFMNCDDILILRHTNESSIESAILKANKYLQDGIEYDFNFDFNNKFRFSCTEFINDLFNGFIFNSEMGIMDSYYKSITRRFNNNVIFPDDFRFASFEVIWEKLF